MKCSRINISKDVSVSTDTQTSCCTLIADIGDAKKSILISLPDSTLVSAYAAPIEAAIKSASRNGAMLQVVTKEPSNLPNFWKHHASQSDQAAFPLIIIDDKIAWYGFPLTEEKFVDHNAGFTTTVHAIARICGENTIEMIKSLCELEALKFGSDYKVKPAPGGFGKFVEQKEFCSQCKSPFKLAHNHKTGKHFLRCSNNKCDATKPLNLQLVDWYMDKYDIKCPDHKCNLTACSGQFGQYLHCEYGHNFKLTDI